MCNLVIPIENLPPHAMEIWHVVAILIAMVVSFLIVLIILSMIIMALKGNTVHVLALSNYCKHALQNFNSLQEEIQDLKKSNS